MQRVTGLKHTTSSLRSWESRQCTNHTPKPNSIKGRSSPTAIVAGSSKSAFSIDSLDDIENHMPSLTEYRSICDQTATERSALTSIITFYMWLIEVKQQTIKICEPILPAGSQYLNYHPSSAFYSVCAAAAIANSRPTYIYNWREKMQLIPQRKKRLSSYSSALSYNWLIPLSSSRRTESTRHKRMNQNWI